MIIWRCLKKLLTVKLDITDLRKSNEYLGPLHSALLDSRTQHTALRFFQIKIPTFLCPVSLFLPNHAREIFLTMILTIWMVLRAFFLSHGQRDAFFCCQRKCNMLNESQKHIFLKKVHKPIIIFFTMRVLKQV